MARVKTVWTVTGPVKDPETKELVVMTVMQGGVTGDRLDVAFANIEKDMAHLAERHGASPSDYATSIAKVSDTKEYFRYVYDIEEAEKIDRSNGGG